MTTEGPSAAQLGNSSHGLIVDSDSLLVPQQLSKDVFLAELTDSLNAQLPGWLAGTGQIPEDCPYIDYWLNYYKDRPASQVERAARLYIGGTADVVASANDYIPLLIERAHKAVDHWLATGEVSDVPSAMPMGSMRDADEAVLSRMAENSSTDTPAVAPRVLLGALGPGQSMPGGVQNRLEENFGASFGDVRLHQDGRAEHLADALHARAFTVGNHVAFARGQFAPGTLHGDLVIAHELAHTMQQQRTTGGTVRTPDPAAEVGLERNADRIAMSAMASDKQYGEQISFAEEQNQPLRNLLDEAGQASVIRQQGLRLSRCKSEKKEEPPAPTPAPIPWWQEAQTADADGEIFVRPVQKFVELEQLLRQVDVAVVKSPNEKLKKRPGAKASEKFVAGIVTTSQWTSESVKSEIEKLFPKGKEIFVDDATITAVKKIVSTYRASHPQSFSTMQGVGMAREVCTEHQCIATMNNAITTLYGNRTIQPKDLGDAAQVAIKNLDDKGLVSETMTFEAKFTATPLRYYGTTENDVSLVGDTPGPSIVKKMQAQEDGVHAFALSVCNGYHSAIIVAKKTGGTVSMAWHDSNVDPIEPASKVRTQTVDAAEIDRKIRAYAAGRFKWLVRDPYFKKVHKIDWPGNASVPDGDPRLPKVEALAEPHAKADIKINTFAKLKPPSS